ncbi:MAG TPA: dipeptide epimerase [Chthoniobacteraceae bacterium]|nr:dipeptide epimerase [Chthoniobacteraceae bacterium]
MKASFRVQTLTPRFVFRINNARMETTRSVFSRLEDGVGRIGHGEGAPSKFFGEHADEVLAKLQGAATWLAGLDSVDVHSPACIGRAWDSAWNFLKPFRAAQAAIDLALWDLAAKRAETSVTELALGQKPRPVKSFATIGLSDADELKAKVTELRGFPLIKVKMDHGVDLEALRYIRDETGASIAIDANRAWTPADLPALSEKLAALGVLFIEQPLPVEDDGRMEILLPRSALPVFADESCATPGQLERMPGRFSGFNIKLSKCGGLTPALKMLRRGRELGLKVMVGCRLESSLSIAAGAVIAQQADYADLDGAWLLGDDPFTGLPLRNGVLTLPDLPGFGVHPVP